jgi:hypothetical protein
MQKKSHQAKKNIIGPTILLHPVESPALLGTKSMATNAANRPMPSAIKLADLTITLRPNAAPEPRGHKRMIRQKAQTASAPGAC